jgi:hypothetical protein
MLPLDTFITLLTGEHTVKTATAVDSVASRLPGVYNRFASDPRLEEDLRTNPYMPGGPAPRRVRHWVVKHAAEWSLDRPRVVERLQLAVLRHPQPLPTRRSMVKVASVDRSEELAKHYALYQLGFLSTHATDPDAAFMQKAAIRSNFVC